MGTIIDISIILIILAFTYIGYRKGLIKVAISFFAIIISIIIALILYKPIAKEIMNNTQLDENISHTIYSKIENIDFENINKDEKENNAILKITETYIDDAIDNATSNIAKYVSDSLTITIVEIITFIGLIIVLRILLLLLNLLSEFISNLPFIKLFNKSGGIIYGILQGIFIVYIIFAIIYIINPIYEPEKLQKAINESKIGIIVYENNFIVDTISK